MQINENQEYVLNTALGLAGGRAAYVWVPVAARRIQGKSYIKNIEKISPGDNEKFWQAGEIARNQHPLLNGKVNIVDINEKNFEQIYADVIQRRRNKKQGSGVLKNLMQRMSEGEYKEKMLSYALGRNACYMPDLSQVLVNREKMSFAIFHELGHAINSKGSGFKKLLAKTRGSSGRAVPYIFGASLLIPADSKKEPTENKEYKAFLWFKKHSGLLASAFMLPLVAEEGMASLNAKKIGKNVLSPELYKKMNKMNLRAFGTYFLYMVSTGVGVTFANYLKDKLTGPLPDYFAKPGTPAIK